MKQFFKKGQVVLFQGDSITDWGRDRSDMTSLSSGYVGKIAAIHRALFPDSGVTMINKGVSGARIPDLIVRYYDDIFDLEPDFISILIGINDVWRRYDSNDPSTVEAFRDHYAYLLDMIKKNMPDTKIMLMEPFLLHSLPGIETWREDLDPKIQVVRELAQKYADYFIPLDGIFAQSCVKGYNPVELATDGVHPTDAGNSVIAESYLKTLGII
ncbi:MAG: SGNH/GDSL hydrolase family protein [Saccharofermentanales bacterium]